MFEIRCPFTVEFGLPHEIVTYILLLPSPNDFLSVSMVCKNCLEIMNDMGFRNSLIETWKITQPSYVINCEFNYYSQRLFRLIKIKNSPSVFQPFSSLLDASWSDNQHGLKMSDVQNDLLCIKFWDRDLITRVLICNPLTRLIRILALPFNTKHLGMC